MSEHDYLVEQHLLLAIKSVDNDESYGKKSLSTHSYFHLLCRINRAFLMEWQWAESGLTDSDYRLLSEESILKMEETGVIGENPQHRWRSSETYPTYNGFNCGRCVCWPPTSTDPPSNTALAVPRWSPIQLLTRPKGIYFSEQTGARGSRTHGCRTVSPRAFYWCNCCLLFCWTGECCIALKTMINVIPQKSEVVLSHLGEKTGQIM